MAEPVLSYEDALLPHALLVGGQRSAERLPNGWHCGRSTADRGADLARWSVLAVGSASGGGRNGPRSTFDEQPIEATAMLLASEAAYAQTFDTRYLDTAERAYGWFLGANDVGVPVAASGDRRLPRRSRRRGANTSQGAKSTRCG